MVATKKAAKPPAKKAAAMKSAAAKKTAPKAKPAEATADPGSLSPGQYALGDLVSHPIFGHGTVAAIDADKLTIEFDGNVVKQIVDYYVKPRKL